jgi:hypothetical protein
VRSSGTTASFFLVLMSGDVTLKSEVWLQSLGLVWSFGADHDAEECTSR